MISPDWIILVSAALLLVLLKAVFIATEFSLIRLRYSHFNPDLLEELQRGKRFAGLMNRTDRTLRFIRLGTTVFTMSLGVLLMPIADRTAVAFGYETVGFENTLIFAVTFLVAMTVHYVLGHLVPRGISLQHPVGTLQVTSWIIRVFQLVGAPLLSFLDMLSMSLLRLFRLDPDVGFNQLDVEAQVRSLNEDSDIPDFTHRVFKNVISMRDLVVQDVMLPRNQIQYFDIFDGNEANVKLSKKSGHTRFPLCEGDLDNCVGIMHIKDIYRTNVDVLRMDFKKMARPVIYFGSNDHLEVVLEKLLDKRAHMALVRDDFGGTVGVVTIENIVEELVGNIQDEFDSEEEQIEEIQEDVFIIDGLTPLHDVEEKLNMVIDQDDVSTIGGLITAELGTIPVVGQKVRVHNLEIEAVEVDEKRVLSARVRVIPANEES